MLNHYLAFGPFTNPGCYEGYLRSKLPSSIPEIGKLVRSQIIHKMVLRNGNTGSNADLRYGDMTKVPWYRQCEDDLFPTAASMLAELFRRDARGLTLQREEKNRLVVTCRFTAILVASILKAKSIPARVRSGFASYFVVDGYPSGKSNDHWINEYWDTQESRWIEIDVDGSIEPYLTFNPYDLPSGTFDFAADAWLSVRKGKMPADHFWNSGGTPGLIAIAWELFYDFHCLMNSEPLYMHTPTLTFFVNFPKLSEGQLKEIDELAYLMCQPDENFSQLLHIWEHKREFRLLGGGLL